METAQDLVVEAPPVAEGAGAIHASRRAATASHDEALVQPSVPAAPVNGLARSLEQRRLRAYLAQMLVDIAILAGSYWLVGFLYLDAYLGVPRASAGLGEVTLVLPLYLTIALYNGTYSLRSLSDWQRAAQRAFVALMVAVALLNFLAFFAKANAEFSRVVFTLGTLTSAAALTASRLAISHLVIRAWGPSPVNRLVILAGGPDISIPQAIHIDAVVHGLDPDGSDPAMLDRLGKYLRNMDEVIVSCDDDHRQAWAAVLKGSGKHGEVVYPSANRIGALGVVHHAAAGVTTLQVSTGLLGIRARVAKRLFDLALVVPGLLLLSPLLLAVALAIKLEDGGPVLFRQRRMGRGNRFFDILKFRSMRVADAEGQRSAARDDDRITHVGRFIRRTSIDELPQLWNIVRGEMSLVGPRPHALGSMAGSKLFWEVDTRYWQRHGLRPGMTGLAQIRGHRGATDTEKDLADRLHADLEYVRSWSIWHDIGILIATLRVVVHHRAY